MGVYYYYYNISYIPQQIEFIPDTVSRSKKHVETSRDIFVFVETIKF